MVFAKRTRSQGDESLSTAKRRELKAVNSKFKGGKRRGLSSLGYSEKFN